MTRRVRVIRAVLLALILLYAAFLRLDGLFKSYGPFDHPRWLVGLQRAVAAAPAAVPDGMTWPRRDIQADGGDPVNYLTFAKEMRGFYQAHVREPVFLATTRVMLALTGGQDVAVSLASILFSLALVVATYLLGASLGSQGVGLAAAAVIAIDYDVVSWSIAGWRDDASSFFCILAAWALVRFRATPGWKSSCALGVVAAFACLTRITSFVYLVPGLVYVAAVGRREGRANRLRFAGVAAALALALIAPYLVRCALEFGDPLYSINYHVRFYAAREQGVAPLEDDVAKRLPGAAGYVLAKFRKQPLHAIDDAIQGLTSYPFNNKWGGLNVWSPQLAKVLEFLALAGLLAWLVQPPFHLMLLLLGASLTPYMMTWPILGGSEWRFTLHAYPFYLVAAFGLARDLGLAGRAFATEGLGVVVARLDRAHVVRQAAAIAVVVAVGVPVAYGIPYLMARNALVRNEPAYLMAGRRDALVFGGGWSSLVTRGTVVARFSTERHTSLYVPLPRRRQYRVVLRMDPFHYDGAPDQHVKVSIGGLQVGEVTLAWNPDRVGTYEFLVPMSVTPSSRVRIDFQSEQLSPVARGGDAFPELPGHLPIAFKLWYVGVLPQ